MNPNRICRVCNDKIRIGLVCPMCEFARLRQSGQLADSEFDLKKELEKFNKEVEEGYLMAEIEGYYYV